MSIIRNIGLFGARLSRPGTLGGILDSIPSGAVRHGGLVNSSAFPKNLYARLQHDDVSEEPVPPSPVTSDIGDICADIYPDIRHLDLRAWIGAVVVGQTRDLRGIILPSWADSSNLYSHILGYVSAHTEPLAYKTILLSTPSGLSIIRRVTTTLPDLTATMHGWAISDLSVYSGIGFRVWHNLYCNIIGIGSGTSDLSGYLGPMRVSDLDCLITTVEPADLLAYLVGVASSDLLTSIVAVAPKDLRAFCGGHLPEDISAYLLVIPPKDITAFIRSGNSSTSDIGSDITSSGYWYNFPASVGVLYRDYNIIRASIVGKKPSDIRALIMGWDVSYLSAYILGQNVQDISSYIKGISTGNIKNLLTFIRPTIHVEENLAVYVKGVISAHTTDKIYNYNLFISPARKFLVGTKKGFSIMTMEQVRGYFPDLHAIINVLQLYTSEMKAFIRTSLPLSTQVSASLYSVTQPIIINKIDLIFRNFSNLSVYISAFSAYRTLSAFIQGSASVSTNTPDDSYWVQSTSIGRHFISTGMGFFVPPLVVSPIRPVYFVNNSPTPDLRAYVYSWATQDLGANITVWPSLSLFSTIVGLDLSHVSYISAFVQSLNTSDLTASITRVGYYLDFSADILAYGSFSSIGASINAYREIKGLRLIPVYLIPFLDLRAIINPISNCGPTSSYSAIMAFIRGSMEADSHSDLYATIDSLSDRLDLSASIIGRKIIRLSILDLYFRTRLRSSGLLYGKIVGVGSSNYDLTSSVYGDFLTSDLTASIIPYRHIFRNKESKYTIDIYRTEGLNAYISKQLHLYFSSGVSEYVYDSVSSAIYPVGNKRWVLNVEELTSTGEFFDRNVNDRVKRINNILEFDSVDEAIREAIYRLADMKPYDIAAYIYGTGGCSHISSYIIGMSLDRVIDMQADIVGV